MLFPRALLGGVLGGILGAAVWAAIAYFLHLQIGWLAWGIGALAGGGALVLIGGKDHATPASGSAAVLAAVLCVLLGKFGAVYFALGHFQSQVATQLVAAVDDEYMIARMVEDRVEELTAAGKPLVFRNGKNKDTAEELNDYPLALVNECRAKWQANSQDERDAQIADAKARLDLFANSSTAAFSLSYFWGTLTLFDLLWFTLASVTAYKLAANDTTQ